MRSPQADVEKILNDMRNALRQNRMSFVKREKNMATLALMGWKFKEVKDAMYALTYSNYVKGPEDDRKDPHGDKLWIFKTNLENQKIYIKFKILYQTDGSIKTLSFHIDGI